MKDFETFLKIEQEKTISKETLRDEKRMKQEFSKGMRIFSITTLAFMVASSLMIFAYAKNIPTEPPQIDENIKEEQYTIDVVVEEMRVVEEVVEEEPYYPTYNIPLDEETQRLLYDACEATGLDMALAVSVIWRETHFQNLMGDGGKSYGYMQVQPRWHKDRMTRLGVTDLLDPYSNFLVGCDFLAELLAKYDLPNALTYYNSGSPGYNQYARDVINYMNELPS